MAEKPSSHSEDEAAFTQAESIDHAEGVTSGAVDLSPGDIELEAKKQEVLNFIDQNLSLIRAARASTQLYDFLGAYERPQGWIEQQNELEAFLEANGREKLDDDQGRPGYLCQIGEGYVQNQHPHLEGSAGDDPNAVRGFRFSFNSEEFENIRYVCVDLDAGRSRAYFDGMSEDDKQRFVQQFADNSITRYGKIKSERAALRYKPSVYFYVFVTDLGSSHMPSHKVEAIVKGSWPYEKFGPEDI